MKKIIITAVLIVAAMTATAQDTMQKPSQFIVDQGNLLNVAQEGEINAIFSNLLSTRQTNGYLLIVDSLPSGQNLLAFTKGIFKKWDLNTAGERKNFIVVYSIKEHGVRIEASDILIQLLTKKYLQDVIDRSIKPQLQKRQDFQGLKRGIQMIAQKIENN